MFLALALACSPVPFEATFRAVAGSHWIDRAAQVKQESRFNPKALSPVGARGIAQFMPSTWAWSERMGWIPAGSDPWSPALGIQAQHGLMSYHEARLGLVFQSWKGTFDGALGAYNAGEGSVRKAVRLARDLGLSDDAAWLRTLPRVTGAHAVETQGYVRQINRFRVELATQ
jgi:soluble lytic murein transglycosylase-like protein